MKIIQLYPSNDSIKRRNIKQVKILLGNLKLEEDSKKFILAKLNKEQQTQK